MNQVLKDIAFRAGFIGESMYPVLGTTQESALENFAEMIVRECAAIAADANLEDVEGGDSSVLRAASEQIKSHFGVE